MVVNRESESRITLTTLFENYKKRWSSGSIVVLGNDSRSLGNFGSIVGGKLGFVVYSALNMHLVEKVNGIKGARVFWKIEDVSVCN